METISHLFAVEAEKLLSSGQIPEAKTLCERGIEVFPDYPLAYALLAKSQFYSGDFQLAQSTLEQASNLFPYHKSLINIRKMIADAGTSARIVNKPISGMPDIIEAPVDYDSADSEINEPEGEQEPPAGSQGDKKEEIKNFLKIIEGNFKAHSEANQLKASNRNIIPGLEFPIFTPSQSGAKARESFGLTAVPDPFLSEEEEELSRIENEMLSKLKYSDDELVKISDSGKNDAAPPKSDLNSGSALYETDDEEDVLSPAESHVATDTIARIYEGQGAYEAAIKVYEKLIEINPGQSELYSEKIELIRNKINS